MQGMGRKEIPTKVLVKPKERINLTGASQAETQQGSNTGNKRELRKTGRRADRLARRQGKTRQHKQTGAEKTQVTMKNP